MIRRTASEVLQSLEDRIARLEGGSRTAASGDAVSEMVKSYTSQMSPAKIKLAIIEKLMKKGFTREEIDGMEIQVSRPRKSSFDVSIGGNYGTIEILVNLISGGPLIETLFVRPTRNP